MTNTDAMLIRERRYWGDWTIEVRHLEQRASIEVRHLEQRTIDGRTLPAEWYATAWLTDTWYDGEQVIGPASTREALDLMVADRCRVIDLGSLDPIDVGCDVRETGLAIAVPLALVVRVRTARSGSHPHGETLEAAGCRLRGMLRERGYTVAVGE